MAYSDLRAVPIKNQKSLIIDLFPSLPHYKTILFFIHYFLNS